MPSPTSLVDLLRHPVRWRILQTLINRTLTTSELSELLPEVPVTTLYRHVGVLQKAGVLLVTEERRVRGAVERTYGLNTAAGAPGDGPIGRDQVRAMFTVFVAGLAADLDRYLERDEIDALRDGIAFRQAALWLTDEEFGSFQERFGEVLAPLVAHEPAPDRVRRVLSTLLIPD